MKTERDWLPAKHFTSLVPAVLHWDFFYTLQLCSCSGWSLLYLSDDLVSSLMVANILNGTRLPKPGTVVLQARSAGHAGRTGQAFSPSSAHQGRHDVERNGDFIKTTERL